MHIRYLIIATRDIEWCRRVADRVEKGWGLVRSIESDRLIVLSGRGGDALSLSYEKGAVVGEIFSQEETPRRILAVSQDMETKLLEADQRRFLSEFWGSYVAVTADSSGEGIRVLRDPSASVPCNFIEAPQGVLFGSDISMLFDAVGGQPQIDWLSVAGLLTRPQLTNEQTALRGVSELLPGQQASVSAASVRVRECWSPWDYVEKGQRWEGPERSSERLRAIVDGCVRARASSFTKVMVGVSGGLDSSIVAAALCSSGVDATYFTRRSNGPAGDERKYARALTDALGADLIDTPYEPGRVDLRWTNTGGLARPGGYTLAQEAIRMLGRHAAETGADGYFSGVGGDSVFCYLLSGAVLADRILVEGLGPGVIRTLWDLCELADCSVWDALTTSLVKVIPQERRYNNLVDSSFMNRDLGKVPNTSAHPWLRPQRGVLPGKMLHVASILKGQSGLDAWPVGPSIRVVAPLLSQPLVEYCLAVPTWAWCAGGHNRVLARQAFADVLPEKVAWRRSKGTPKDAVATVYKSNKNLLKEMLLGGLLAANGILDVGAVEGTLNDSKYPSGRGVPRLLQLADAEAWAQGWA